MRSAWRLWILAALIGLASFAASVRAETTPLPSSDALGSARLAPSDDDDDDDSEVEDADEVEYEENRGDGAPRNVVEVRNRSDGRLRVRGRIELNRIEGAYAEPINQALAYSSCTDCQTIAVALQLNLISRTADYVAPRNTAEAVNYECTRCRTFARALQYTFSVDDPEESYEDIDRLIREMERELRQIRRERDITATEAAARVNAVIGRFQSLAAGLDDRLAETEEPTSPGAPAPATPAFSVLAPTPTPTGETTSPPTRPAPAPATTPVPASSPTPLP